MRWTRAPLFRAAAPPTTTALREARDHPVAPREVKALRSDVPSGNSLTSYRSASLGNGVAEARRAPAGRSRSRRGTENRHRPTATRPGHPDGLRRRCRGPGPTRRSDPRDAARSEAQRLARRPSPGGRGPLVSPPRPPSATTSPTSSFPLYVKEGRRIVGLSRSRSRDRAGSSRPTMRQAPLPRGRGELLKRSDAGPRPSLQQRARAGSPEGDRSARSG